MIGIVMHDFFTTLKYEIQDKLGCLPNESLEALTHGRSVRFGNGRKKDYFLFINKYQHNNQTHYDATFGDWHEFNIDRETKHNVSSFGEIKLVSDSARKKINEVRRLSVEKAKAASLEAEKAAIKKWLEVWNKSKPGPHRYTDLKQIPQDYTRLYNGDLLVPMYDESLKIKAFQRILKTPFDGGNDKLMVEGTRATGKFYHLKDFTDARKVFLTEGFADAATLQMVTDVPCITAFSCGNITGAIEAIKKVNQKCLIVIAGDNDKAGLAAIEKAKAKYSNVSSILPTTENDFSDEYKKFGVKHLKDLINGNKDKALEIIPRGFDGGVYFYQTTDSQQLTQLSFKEHNEAGFRHLLPNKKYWEEKFGYSDNKGNQRIDYGEAAFYYQSESKKKGVFDATKNRGLGIWFEGSEMIINTGDGVINEQPGSKYFYEGGKSFRYAPGDISGMIAWVNMVSEIKMREDVGGIYLAAWFVQSYIFPCLDWRQQTWLTADKQFGKTTILKWLSRTSLFGEHIKNGTAPGLRQIAASNQTAIIYDETEPSPQMKKVLDFMREVSSNDGAQVVRGTASQKAIIFNPQANFLFGSIQVSLLNDADKSRILICDLERQNDGDLYTKRENQSYIAASQKESFFYWLIQKLPEIQEMRNIAMSKLKLSGLEPRQSEQLGGVIACFGVVYLYKDISPSKAVETILGAYDFTGSEYAEESDQATELTIIEELASCIVDKKEFRTMFMIMKNVVDKAKGWGSESYQASEDIKLLAVHGIKYLSENNTFFIHPSNTNLLKLLPDHQGFGRVLLRSEKYKVTKSKLQIMEGGGRVNGICVDAAAFVCG